MVIKNSVKNQNAKKRLKAKSRSNTDLYIRHVLFDVFGKKTAIRKLFTDKKLQ